MQPILQIIWNFMNRLNEELCKQYVGIHTSTFLSLSFIVIAEISVTLGFGILHILQSMVGLEL